MKIAKKSAKIVIFGDKIADFSAILMTWEVTNTDIAADYSRSTAESVW